MVTVVTCSKTQRRHINWRRKSLPTPVLLPGESQGRRAWWAASMGSHGVGHDRSDLAAAALY